MKEAGFALHGMSRGKRFDREYPPTELSEDEWSELLIKNKEQHFGYPPASVRRLRNATFPQLSAKSAWRFLGSALKTSPHYWSGPRPYGTAQSWQQFDMATDPDRIFVPIRKGHGPRISPRKNRWLFALLVDAACMLDLRRTYQVILTFQEFATHGYDWSWGADEDVVLAAWRRDDFSFDLVRDMQREKDAEP